MTSHSTRLLRFLFLSLNGVTVAQEDAAAVHVSLPLAAAGGRQHREALRPAAELETAQQ
jgi:hypothetical protein